MGKNLVALALEWMRLDEALKAAKAAELEKRLELVGAVFPAGVAQGTNRLALPGGYEVKAVVKPSPKIDPVGVMTGLAKLKKLGAAGKLLAERLIKWKPDLSISEWKKLSDEQRALFEGSVTLADSTPSVEVTVPA